MEEQQALNLLTKVRLPSEFTIFIKDEGQSMNELKSKQLGMPFGTASNRLRKAILFKYVKKAGDNFCYKCTLEIILLEDLSIEHKKPWQGKETFLFWDLDNIAFSHLKCNTPEPGPHGVRGKYNYGCRCDKCREAQMAHQRKYREENRDELNRKRRIKYKDL